jgi:hypothetical protein
MAIVLQKEELDELLELTRKAGTTPVILLPLPDPFSQKDLSAQAWDKVRAKWDELGRKYGFDPREVKGISTETGEVLL